MRGTTIIMILASLVFIIIGILILLNKKIAGVIGGGMSPENHKAYIKFIGTFYLSVGSICMIFGILDYFFAKYSLLFVILFALIMISSSMIQMKIATKYIK
ncbi:hypothetical protein [Clostridium paridis]|uniref:DUF3784 domain-containing protein n=1 Tax=Clostridium paridis TaxID=2803863 RepID=A0A937FG91_9CLOT|nr:hypothetical protein [Clostridium paridis]MBL4931458.1 hypothetical protein [Clostridium paridis]